MPSGNRSRTEVIRNVGSTLVFRLNVEAKMHDIAFLHDVILALEA